jgi:hypothetical protein
VGHISSKSFSIIFVSKLTIYAHFQAEGPDAFSQFHLYVCSAFLVKWSEKLRQMDFQVGKSLTLLAENTSTRFCFHPGYHHVPAILANTRLGRPSNRDAPQRSICSQFNMAQCTESFQREVTLILSSRCTRVLKVYDESNKCIIFLQAKAKLTLA